MPLPVNDPFIGAIRDRLCTIVEGQAHLSLELAKILDVETDPLRVLLEELQEPIDVALLIDVVAAVVREFAVDPQWLLTGHYDSTAHRRALALGEDRSDDGRRALSALVREQYQRLRDALAFYSWSLLRGP